MYRQPLIVEPGVASWGRLADSGGLDSLWPPTSGAADSGQVWAVPVTGKGLRPGAERWSLLTNEDPYSVIGT